MSTSVRGVFLAQCLHHTSTDQHAGAAGDCLELRQGRRNCHWSTRVRGPGGDLILLDRHLVVNLMPGFALICRSPSQVFFCSPTHHPGGHRLRVGPLLADRCIGALLTILVVLAGLRLSNWLQPALTVSPTSSIGGCPGRPSWSRLSTQITPALMPFDVRAGSRVTSSAPLADSPAQ